MRIVRLHRSHRPTADYSGSLVFGARWNPPGTPILYCSTSLSLACLEILVHLPPDEFPREYVYSTAELTSPPETSSFRGDLTDDDATRRYGHGWATSPSSFSILVPSVIIPIEHNVLLNPTHEAFESVVWSTPEPFSFDPRLLRRSSASFS